MITLEQILQSLGCKKPFDKKGNFTKKGHKTFIMLEQIIEQKHLNTIKKNVIFIDMWRAPR